jgi:hypothetical protein
MLPDVIEISASRRDDEVEERERLRDAAAQSIGLDPTLMSTEPDGSAKDVDESEHSFQNHQDLIGGGNLDIIPTDGRYPTDSSISMKKSLSGSLRKNSLSPTKPLLPTKVPDFPCTVFTLSEFTQNSSTLHKYYPPTSLHLFTLSKNWKNRFLALSSCPSGPSQGPIVYLHLFRASGVEEKELERLEINEESVVFVAEESVSGRKNVINVGGVGIGALGGPNHAQRGQTMWLLHILDPPEAQKWISLIKSIILGKR